VDDLLGDWSAALQPIRTQQPSGLSCDPEFRKGANYLRNQRDVFPEQQLFATLAVLAVSLVKA